MNFNVCRRQPTTFVNNDDDDHDQRLHKNNNKFRLNIYWEYEIDAKFSFCSIFFLQIKNVNNFIWFLCNLIFKNGKKQRVSALWTLHMSNIGLLSIFKINNFALSAFSIHNFFNLKIIFNNAIEQCVRPTHNFLSFCWFVLPL